jgi:glucokinase
VPGPSPESRHLGLDLGGTNVKWTVVERAADGWRMLDRGQVTTLAERGPVAVVERLASVARQAVSADRQISTVGIGVPGLYDPAAGTTRFLPNLPGTWAGVAVAKGVGGAVGLPAALVNDARAFGLAELRLGAARRARSMIGLTIGTGVGGVIVLDGHVYHGRDGTGGELGHQTIEPDGPACGCGNRGCLEALTRADRIAAACGTATAEEAVVRARSGDPRASSGIARIGRYLGIGIANAVTVFTPEIVVIGGGLAAADRLLLDPIDEEIRMRVRTTSVEHLRVVTAELGTWAGAIGAAIHGAESRRPAPSAAVATAVAR